MRDPGGKSSSGAGRAGPQRGRSAHKPTPHSYVRPEAQAAGYGVREVIAGHVGTTAPTKQQGPPENQHQAQDVLLSHPGPQPSPLLNGYELSSPTGPSRAGARPEGHRQVKRVKQWLEQRPP